MRILEEQKEGVKRRMVLSGEWSKDNADERIKELI